MSGCDFIYQYGGPCCPYPCSHEAEFEVYDFKAQRTVKCCLEHVGLIIKDMGRSCMVKPLHEELANRSPDDRRTR